MVENGPGGGGAEDDGDDSAGATAARAGEDVVWNVRLKNSAQGMGRRGRPGVGKTAGEAAEVVSEARGQRPLEEGRDRGANPGAPRSSLRRGNLRSRAYLRDGLLSHKAIEGLFAYFRQSLNPRAQTRLISTRRTNQGNVQK